MLQETNKKNIYKKANNKNHGDLPDITSAARLYIRRHLACLIDNISPPTCVYNINISITTNTSSQPANQSINQISQSTYARSLRTKIKTSQGKWNACSLSNVLTTPKVISEWVPTCDGAHSSWWLYSASPMGDKMGTNLCKVRTHGGFTVRPQRETRPSEP